MHKIQIPPGKTWFGIQKCHFADVPVTQTTENGDGISITEFLEATESTTTIFDLLGSAVFTPIKQDMLFNVNRVRERQKQNNTVQTLQQLIKDESSLPDSGKPPLAQNATEGLTWLVRGLDFMAHAFRADLTTNKDVAVGDKHPRKELGDLFRESYKVTLAPYHGVLIRPIFRAAMSAAPRRRDFYIRLSGQGVDPELARQELERWVDALEKIVGILQKFLASVNKPESKSSEGKEKSAV
ncbi:hypothetical protein ABEF92_001450 [Exophiala dermatitidis]|uniref:Pleckstrin domain containing, family A (Phosphoinositide binding specific) member 8 n=1 Tax=Exophiala dermatitidis (strain ATCC 34100 / CBS 525.76 / NIH/UT8656) TaxID=858893 RepID=H6BNQ3_EXODN|nr:pleckstrin domain containing, family A (phosphoinositide binding specific) member 8 [Exophiala dermatitidis NIH/UT8656]XP_009153697.1 pleckstrin domain containing, family A (phosphoinositide binding specific) member 8, variant 3 [Exophiala dermatitidis NIH/UT8656]XP_009153698.1 pleckstrin domain containing, family A (phosphoinositide binding specific) member 8, variant 2 [Exophiala dermatitidis NIH/UT8656]XP_009153699.1 pleckstrin domain containing, family A (phosphoinositide binding specific